jgi:hypothetical protein
MGDYWSKRLSSRMKESWERGWYCVLEWVVIFAIYLIKDVFPALLWQYSLIYPMKSAEPAMMVEAKLRKPVASSVERLQSKVEWSWHVKVKTINSKTKVIWLKYRRVWCIHIVCPYNFIFIYILLIYIYRREWNVYLKILILHLYSVRICT